MKPILFNTEMVRAILDGRKSVTRRVVKPQPVFQEGETGTPVRCDDGSWCFKIDQYNEAYDFELKSPYLPGDILYVRETWAHIFGRYVYIADYKEANRGFWRPSIHMPKEAARIFLRVTGIRAERLQDIKNDQAVDEGAVKRPNYTKRGYLVLHNRYREEFAKLWDSTVKKADLPHYGWDADPWVWVIEFERVSREEAVKGGGEK